MAGITALTAMEINNHPYDLQILIFQINEEGKYAFVVNRGPTHNYKLLISTTPFAETVPQVVREIKNLLEGIHLWATNELKNGESLLTQIINPSGQVDISKTLNSELINKIIEVLQQKQIADTHLMFAITSRGQ